MIPDALFAEPKLAEIYDLLDSPDRPDLSPYLAIADSISAHSVIDLGCGSGTLACRLAARGFEVVGIDPAAASLSVAKRKAYADQVRWITGTAAQLKGLHSDLHPITKRRGLPDDVSWTVKKDYEYDLADLHDPSYLAWQEIERIDWEEMVPVDSSYWYSRFFDGKEPEEKGLEIREGDGDQYIMVSRKEFLSPDWIFLFQLMKVLDDHYKQLQGEYPDRVPLHEEDSNRVRLVVWFDN